MTGTVESPFSFSRKWLKRLFQHWSAISVLMIFLSTGFGMLSLYIYTLAIGRVDIFMSTLDSRSALLVWVICIVFVMIIQLCILMACSCLFASSIALVSRHRSRTRLVGLWMAVPVIVGLAAFVLLVFYFSDRVNAGGAVSIVAFVTVVTLLGLSRIPTLRVLIAAGAPLGARNKIYVPIAVMLVLTVISGSLPLLLILDSYVGQDDQAAVNFVAVFSICTLVLSLVPVLLFYLLKGDIYRRIFIAGLCIFSLFMVYLITSRGAMSNITYIVAGKLEMRQMQVTRFILDDQVRLGDLDSLQWHTRLRPDNRVQVEAYQLFTLGDILLMCPTALRRTQLHRLPEYTKLCLITLNSKVSRMPPRLQTIVGRPARDIWTETARHIIAWPRVRVRLLHPLKLTL